MSAPEELAALAVNIHAMPRRLIDQIQFGAALGFGFGVGLLFLVGVIGLIAKLNGLFA
jgi:hypothetical protein